MQWVKKIHDIVDLSAGYISGAIVFVLMMLNTLDVLCRYLFNSPIPSTFEFSEMLLALIIFLAIPYVQFNKAHISIEIFSERYPVRTKRIFDITTAVISLVLCIVIAIQGLALFLSSLDIKEVSEGKIGFSITAFKWSVAFGFGLMALRIFSQLIDSIKESHKEKK